MLGGSSPRSLASLMTRIKYLRSLWDIAKHKTTNTVTAMNFFIYVLFSISWTCLLHGVVCPTTMHGFTPSVTDWCNCGKVSIRSVRETVIWCGADGQRFEKHVYLSCNKILIQLNVIAQVAQFLVKYSSSLGLCWGPHFIKSLTSQEHTMINPHGATEYQVHIRSIYFPSWEAIFLDPTHPAQHMQWFPL